MCGLFWISLFWDILRHFHACHTSNAGSVYQTTSKNTVCHKLPRFAFGVTLFLKNNLVYDTNKLMMMPYIRGKDDTRIRLPSTILTLTPWDAWISITSWSSKSYPRISVVSGCGYVLPASSPDKPHPAIDMQGWGLGSKLHRLSQNVVYITSMSTL